MIIWLKRIALSAVLLIAFVIAAGTVTEQIARRAAWHDFPPPGKLVDIGGRDIQLDCRGTGSPVVVFESGLDTLGSLSWSAVHDNVARTTRACAYSRAGIMWSDPSNRPFNSLNVAEDLHKALERAGEKPPYVMVGHSMGGPYILAFTGRYASDVAGIVFVDASHPDQFPRLRAAAGKDVDAGGELRLADALAWSGLVRLIINASSIGLPHMPSIDIGPARAFMPQGLHAAREESDALDATAATGRAAHRLGDRPLVVLTHDKNASLEMARALNLDAAAGMRLDATWLSLQNDEASWSSRSHHDVVKGATHYIQFDRPDAVVAAVRDVVGDVRNSRTAR